MRDGRLASMRAGERAGERAGSRQWGLSSSGAFPGQVGARVPGNLNPPQKATTQTLQVGLSNQQTWEQESE